MRAAGIIMIAVSVTPRPLVDEAELRLIAGDDKRAFTPPNLHVIPFLLNHLTFSIFPGLRE